MDLESMAWNPRSKTVLDSFSLGDLNIKEHPLLFSFHLPPLLFLCAFPLNTHVYWLQFQQLLFRMSILIYNEYIVTIIKQSQ